MYNVINKIFAKVDNFFENYKYSKTERKLHPANFCFEL